MTITNSVKLHHRMKACNAYIKPYQIIDIKSNVFLRRVYMASTKQYFIIQFSW